MSWVEAKQKKTQDRGEAEAITTRRGKTEARHQNVEVRPRLQVCCLEARLLLRDTHHWVILALTTLQWHAFNLFDMVYFCYKKIRQHTVNSMASFARQVPWNIPACCGWGICKKYCSCSEAATGLTPSSFEAKERLHVYISIQQSVNTKTSIRHINR